jgi:dTDP-4-dehydrorhamnose 3,5-epimerase
MERTSMEYKFGHIDGVVIRELVRYQDKRGWLMELFRADEITNEYTPIMSYISQTESGIARGPHEHKDQADVFCFIGPSTFRLYLWDARQHSSTFGHRMVFEAGEQRPQFVIIPSGVVHAYQNVGKIPGWVLNFPNRLYAGKGRKELVDEIRHENDNNSTFKLD